MNHIFSDLLKAKGVTKYRVYKDTGISQTTLNDYENGKYDLKIDKLEILADYFGVSVDYLRGIEQKEKPLINGDEELTEYLDMLRNRSEMRMLFSTTKAATKAQIEAIVKMVEEMQGNK